MGIRDLILRHEGVRLKPYRDSQGLLTIGVGRCLDRAGISREEALLLFEHDLLQVQGAVHRECPWWTTLDEVRQAVILDMAFNLGMGGLLSFVKFCRAMEQHDWTTAKLEMLNSKWAVQVGKRAIDDAAMIETGEWVL